MDKIEVEKFIKESVINQDKLIDKYSPDLYKLKDGRRYYVITYRCDGISKCKPSLIKECLNELGYEYISTWSLSGSGGITFAKK